MGYTLVIKGGIVDAERALMERGFHPSDWLTQPKIFRPTATSNRSTSVVTVRDEDEAGVMRWYSEDSAQPFPVGTLLHYTKNAALKLTDSQESTIVNALCLAARSYEESALQLRNVETLTDLPSLQRRRLAEQFDRQAQDAHALAEAISAFGLTDEEEPQS